MSKLYDSFLDGIEDDGDPPPGQDEKKPSVGADGKVLDGQTIQYADTCDKVPGVCLPSKDKPKGAIMQAEHDYTFVPNGLREKGRFCVWRAEKVKTKDGTERVTKVPYDPRTGRPGDPTEPTVFTTWAAAEKAAAGYDGIGVFIGDGICCIDIDGCVAHGERGGIQLTDTAQEIYDVMDCYAEISPSGSGLHLFFCVSDAFTVDGTQFYTRHNGVECYRQKHFVTVTGELISVHSGPDLEERDVEFLTVLNKFMRKPSSQNTEKKAAPSVFNLSLDDKELLAAIDQSSDTKLKDLLAGKWESYDYPTQSEADAGLCAKLLFWTAGDTTQAERLFYHSELSDRSKWARDDYRERTMAAAQKAWNGECYHPPKKMERAPEHTDADAPPGKTRSQKADKPQAPRPTLRAAASVPLERPHYLWSPYIQTGKLNLVQADPGSGKTAFLCGVCAHISTGSPILDNPVQLGNVLFISVEDDLGVLRGRIDADGGDLNKIYFLDNAAGLTFCDPVIWSAVKEVKAAAVVFDPLQAFMGAGVNMTQANETRPILAQLAALCGENNCAGIIVSHLGKSIGDKSPVLRSLGSVDIPGAMRSILQITKDIQNTESRVAVHVKSSNARAGDSIEFRIVDPGKVEFIGVSDMTVEDLAVIQRRQEKGVDYDKEPLVAVFCQFIADNPGGGFISYSDFKEYATKTVGHVPYSDNNDLRRRIDKEGLGKELLRQDGILVTTGASGAHNTKGLRVESYKVPDGYQTSINLGEKGD